MSNKKELFKIYNNLRAMQFTKKLVSLILGFTVVLTVVASIVNLKNGFSLDTITIKWLEYSMWIVGLYLAKSFAETYSEEKNKLDKYIINKEFGHKSQSPIGEEVENEYDNI